jgi:hypothetical protein
MLRLAADVSAIRALGDPSLPRGLERCLGHLQTLSSLCDPLLQGDAAGTAHGRPCSAGLRTMMYSLGLGCRSQHLGHLSHIPSTFMPIP